MNVHVSIEIQNKFQCLDFRGKPRRYKGRTIIEGYHRTLHQTFYYSFEEDFAWIVNTIPDWFLPKV